MCKFKAYPHIALVTDAMRAEYLEKQGYEAQILEFIDMEHTPKNILLRGVKKMDEKDAISQGLLKYIGEDVDKAYLDCVFERRVNPDAIAKAADERTVSSMQIRHKIFIFFFIFNPCR